jgi:mannosyltransferase
MEITDSNHMSYRVEYGLLILLTLLAAGLRFYKLTEWSYWVDEYFTWEAVRDYSQPPLSGLFYPNTRHAFWMLTNLSFDVLGTRGTTARFPPFILGVATIPAVYFSVKKMFDGRIGLITAFMLAVSPWHIYNSQIARWYTILLLCMFFALMSFYHFIDSKRYSYLFLYFILFYAGFTLHLSAGFVPMIAAFYVFLLLVMPSFRSANITPKQLLVVLSAHIGLFLALLPRLRNFLASWKALEDVFGVWERDFILKLVYHMTPSIIIAAVAGLLILMALRDRRGLFLTVCCALPPTLLSAGLLLLGLNVGTRYFLFILPAVLMAASYACIQYKEQMRKHATAFAALVLLLILLPSLQAGYIYFTSGHGYRNRLKEAMQFVERNLSSPEDRIYCPGAPCQLLAQMDRMGIDDRMFITSNVPVNGDLANRIWVLVAGGVSAEPQGEWKWILDNTQLVSEFDSRVGTFDQSVHVFLHSPSASD